MLLPRRAPAAFVLAALVLLGSSARAAFTNVSANAGANTLTQDLRTGAFTQDDDSTADVGNFSGAAESVLGNPDGGAGLRARASVGRSLRIDVDQAELRCSGRFELAHLFDVPEQREGVESRAQTSCALDFCSDLDLAYRVTGSAQLAGGGERFRFKGVSDVFSYASDFARASFGQGGPVPLAGLAADLGAFSSDVVAPPSDSMFSQGEILAGCYRVSASADGRLLSPLRSAVSGVPLNPPFTSGRFELRLELGPTGPPDGDVFRWVGPAQGGFGTAGNWEDEDGNPGVPGFVSFQDADTALVDTAGDLTLDFGNALSRGVPRGLGSAHTGRFVATRSGTLRTVAGSLVVDSLGLDLPKRSFAVGETKTVLVESFDIQARHAILGLNGPGTLELGAGGSLATTGRLGLGGTGPGTLRIRDGGAVVSQADTLIGEAAPGSAEVTGTGSVWETGNLAVGHQADGELFIGAGADVDSFEAFVDFGLQGDDRAEVFLEGTSAESATWEAEELTVGGRGRVRVGEAGGIGTGLLQIGGAASADCQIGGCVEVDGGSLAALQIAVGVNGDGGLESRASSGVFGNETAAGFANGLGRLAADGSFQQAFSGSLLRLGVEPGGRGELALANGATAEFDRGRVGVDCSTPACGRIELTGGSSAEFFGELLLGSEVPAVGPALKTGLVRLDASGLAVHASATDPSLVGDLLVRPGGRVEGSGVVAVEGAVRNDGFIGCGIAVSGAFVSGPLGVVECSGAGGAPPAPQLNPPDESPFRPPVCRPPEPPPPPPPRTLRVSGDATLGGRLVLQFMRGFAPSLGQGFELLDVEGAIDGAFESVEVRGLAPGADFAQDLVGGKLILTSLTDAEPLPQVSVAAKSAVREDQFKKGVKVKLKRTGDTSEALAVRYELGGSAQPGIDYEVGPGVVEIPARKKRAKLLIRPFPDGIDDPAETIELRLVPGESYQTGAFDRVTIELQPPKVKKKKKKR